MTINEHYGKTLIGSLASETNRIRFRCESIMSSILNSNDSSLLTRLNNEFENLEKRRADILKIAIRFKQSNANDILSIDYLIEVCSRPIKLNTNLDLPVY